MKILDSSGEFEISESNNLVARGKVFEVKNMVFAEPSPTVEKDTEFVPGTDLYDEVRILGYEYGPSFRKLLVASLDGNLI